jgi:hypothetical protein
VYIHGKNQKGLIFPVNDAYLIPRPFFDEIRQRIQERSRVDRTGRKALLPTSGLIVALWLLEMHQVPELTLAGFDHFSKDESGRHHYWHPQSFKQPPEHDGAAEAEIVAELIARGRVKRL